MALDNQLIVQTYIAYVLGQKRIILQDEIFNVIDRVTGRTGTKDANDQYVKRSLRGLKSIGAMVDTTRVRRVIDNAEIKYTQGWEDLFESSKKFRYEGRQVRLANINEPHLTPLDYTFTLKPYDEVPEKLKPLYRIVLFINSEYSANFDEQTNKVNSFIESYSRMITPTHESVGEMYSALEYISKAIELENDIEDPAEMEEYLGGETVEERLEQLGYLLVDLKMNGYGFKADPIIVDPKYKGSRRMTDRGIRKPNFKEYSI